MSRHGENIFKRKDKRWEGRYICGRTEGGRARYKLIYAHSNAECQRKLNNFKNNAEISGMKITVSRLFEAWLESRKNRVKQSAYVNYKTLYDNHIRDIIGGMLCENITAEMLNRYASYLLECGGVYGGGLAVKSVRAILVILKAMFDYGSAEYGFCDPAKRLSLPKTEVSEIEVFGEEDLKKLCGLSESGNPMLIGIVLCLNTGIRIGEVCALKWSDIDLDSCVLHVRKTLQRIKILTKELPKLL